MRTSLWPSGLVGRVGLVLFAAVVLELFGSTFVFEQAELVSSDDAQARRIAEQLDAAARILSVTAKDKRAAVVATLSEPSLRLEWRASIEPAPAFVGIGRAKSVRDKILDAEPKLAERQLAVHADPDDPQQAVDGHVDLDDGSALQFHATVLGSPLPTLYNQFGSILVLSSAVLLAALLLVRTLAAPLRMLVQATDAIGHGPSVHLDESGPREIRRVATAFNAMQARIAKLVGDRTQALAAVSHDLKTPIARMKLRTGFLGSTEDQAAFEADLGEMEAMLNDLNAFLGGESDPEKPRPTDLAAMLQTIADAAADAGQSVSFAGPDRLTLSVRALAVKRAMSNIINNAISYGGGVRIRLGEDADTVVATFDDDGPGIQEAEIARVFEPFVRGDASRSRVTGGMGLGLAITRQAIWREHGVVTLANRPEGGLRVTVSLPRMQS